MSFENFFALAGGLGLFLLGMNLMGDGIEKACGAKLRSILEIFTTNRIMGMIVGIIFTGIIQSSSACTAMVVSFVNSGLMNLYQAAGVIFGANIGTTVTGQLVSFDLSKYAPLILLIGVVMVMFSRKPIVQRIGDIIIGFGVLFMGIDSMKGSIDKINESGQISDILLGLTNPLLAILIGTVITAVVQSSSVTVAILIVMAKEGLFGDINICFYIILGCNIGACTTALIKSLAGKKDAKRAAFIHLLFNIIGTILMFVILQLAANEVASGIRGLSADEGRMIANAHSIFKVFQVLVLLPFSGLIVKLTYLFIPGEDAKVGYQDSFQLQYIGDKVLFNPTTAVVDGLKELERMASLSYDNLNRSMNALITMDDEDIKQVYEVEKNINFLNKSITHYLVKINQSTLPIDDLQGLGSLFHVANDIERIGDHAANIADMATRRKAQGVVFSKDAQTELTQMLEAVDGILEKSKKFILSGGDGRHMSEIAELETKVDDMEKLFQQHHIDRLTAQDCTAEAGMIFSDVISGLERVADHAVNIARYLQNRDSEAE